MKATDLKPGDTITTYEEHNRGAGSRAGNRAALKSARKSA